MWRTNHAQSARTDDQAFSRGFYYLARDDFDSVDLPNTPDLRQESVKQPELPARGTDDSGNESAG